MARATPLSWKSLTPAAANRMFPGTSETGVAAGMVLTIARAQPNQARPQVAAQLVVQSKRFH